MGKIAIIYDDVFMAHDNREHIENAERLRHLIPAIKKSGINHQIDWFKPVPALEEEITLIHSTEMLENVKQKVQEGGGWIDPDTYVSPGSLDAALAAAGSGKLALGLVFRRNYKRVFIPARPPGHHATSSRSMGFCLFNNAALCARIALDYNMAGKIVLIDWDIHHGNGTEELFYTDDRVLVMSVHQALAFPGTGYEHDTGINKGKGFTVNIPLPEGAGNEAYLTAFQAKFRPEVEKFQPDLFIVSAGFGGHFQDSVGEHKVDAFGYREMASLVREMAENSPARGKIIAFLEGGFHPIALADSVMAMLKAWIDEDEKPPTGKMELIDNGRGLIL